MEKTVVSAPVSGGVTVYWNCGRKRKDFARSAAKRYGR